MNRASTERASSRFLAAATLVVSLAALGPGAQAGQNGSGIWVYNGDWSNSIVNLTNYNLRVETYGVDSNGCFAGNEQATTEWLPYRLNAYTPNYVEPYRTWEFGVAFGCNGDPYNYEGNVVFKFDGTYLQDSGFQVVFKRQEGSGTAGKVGTWVGLSRHDTSQMWAAPNIAANGRWTTAIDDNKMHNIMTLINPKMMVALYSPDNKNVVLVVQQFNESASGWNDQYAYDGVPLDWVDNSDGSVPGQS